MPDRML